MMPEVCSFCDKDLSEDATENWWGESGKPYCSEDCMNEAGDAPDEDDDED